MSGFLDAAELRVRNHTITTMSECVALCDQYIGLTGGQLLEGRGRMNKSQADRRAREEFAKFDKRNISDFDRFVQNVQKQQGGSAG
uniref:RhuM family protein n=1 Tax=Bifidobacterium xylocopae TaxID=2493119 RepID=UPI001F492685|nr:RhuM family protein [Bifidobacterium xylocopae]